MTRTKILPACLAALSVAVTLLLVLRNLPPYRFSSSLETSKILDARAENGTSLGVGEQYGVSKHNDKPNEKLHADEQDGLSENNDKPDEKLHGGLIAPGFDENTCLSRYQSVLYRKNSLHEPSSYLILKLRIYEELHRKCGPHTKSYNKTMEQLKSTGAKKRKKHLKSGHNVSFSECKYVVWISNSGLGNRILSIASAFLYALLTNRVLLVDPGNTMDDLFCEPFPENSWFLPLDSPLKNQIHRFNKKTPHSFGNLLKTNTSMSSHVYLYLANDYDDHDKHFFRDEYHSLIEEVPWLTMLSNQYFVPSLFLIPSFEPELRRLFPEKETVFHHLSRYLFHPTNHVWGLITRYYQAYLAKADETIGIQVRTFESEPGPFKHIEDQILACTQKENLLPEVDKNTSMKTPLGKPKHKVVLITTLTSGYFEILKDLYWENPTVSGDIIGVYQPSQEGRQQTEKTFHNRKAWAEIYLLSLCDVLVTSPWSTFGYVAQGLGGLKPWILSLSYHRTVPNPPCSRAMSMEPCFHFPPFNDQEAKRVADTGALVPYVRHCEDMRGGVKLVDSHK